MTEKLTKLVVISAVIAFMGYKWWDNKATIKRLNDYRQAKDNRAVLIQRLNRVFGGKKEIEKVVDGVYVSQRFGFSNVGVIEGPEGLIFIDAMESIPTATETMEAIKKITSKPLKALIYTHFHFDHTGGAKAFIDGYPKENVEVWAHKLFTYGLYMDFSVVNTAMYKRSVRQFGPVLSAHNAGLDIFPNISHKSPRGFVLPTRFVEHSQEIVQIAGTELTLVHIPGETDDQLGIWLPKQRVFFSADDIYKAFPNLYAIRGTPFRDMLQWINSIDIIRSLKPEHLVVSHGTTMHGEAEIFKELTLYRDAIQYVHDQTVRYMNLEMHPDDIAAKISLPESMQNNPFLLEVYGTVQWSVKGLFQGYMGWFSGDPVDLNPLPPKVRAQRLVKLAGGREAILTAAAEALEAEDPQWALELATTLLKLEPSNAQATELRIKALMDIGNNQISSLGYHYYMTCAYEELGKDSSGASAATRTEITLILPLQNLFNLLCYRFKPEECPGLDKKVFFNFTDTEATIGMHVRNSIVELIHDLDPKSADLNVLTTEQIWRELFGGIRNRMALAVEKDFVVTQGLLAFKAFMDCFEMQ